MAINTQVLQPVQVTADRYQGLSPFQEEAFKLAQEKVDITKQLMRENELGLDADQYDAAELSKIETEFRDATDHLRENKFHSGQVNEILDDYYRIKNSYRDYHSALGARKQDFTTARDIIDKTVTDPLFNMAYKHDLANTPLRDSESGDFITNPSQGMVFRDMPNTLVMQSEIAKLTSKDGMELGGEKIKVRQGPNGEEFYTFRQGKEVKITPKKILDGLTEIVENDPNVQEGLKKIKDWEERGVIPPGSYDERVSQIAKQAAGLAGLMSFSDITANESIIDASKSIGAAGTVSEAIDVLSLATPEVLVTRNIVGGGIAPELEDLQSGVETLSKGFESLDELVKANTGNPLPKNESGGYAPISYGEAATYGMTEGERIQYNIDVSSYNDAYNLTNRVDQLVEEKMGITLEELDKAAQIAKEYRKKYNTELPEGWEPGPNDHFISDVLDIGLKSALAAVDMWWNDKKTWDNLSKVRDFEDFKQKAYEQAWDEYSEKYGYQTDMPALNFEEVKDLLQSKNFIEKVQGEKQTALNIVSSLDKQAEENPAQTIESLQFIDKQGRNISIERVLDVLGIKGDKGKDGIKEAISNSNLSLNFGGFEIIPSVSRENNKQIRVAITDNSKQDNPKTYNVYATNDQIQKVGDILLGEELTREAEVKYLEKVASAKGELTSDFKDDNGIGPDGGVRLFKNNKGGYTIEGYKNYQNEEGVLEERSFYLDTKDNGKPYSLAEAVDMYEAILHEHKYGKKISGGGQMGK